MSDKQRYSWITATALASILSASAYANEPPSLLQIMQQLGRDLNQISDGMLSEDYAAIAKAAQAIAEHPLPRVAERTKIIGGLGADAGRFRQGDQAVHDAALAVKDAAATADNAQILQSYMGLVQGCMDCHNTFRARVRALSAE